MIKSDKADPGELNDRGLDLWQAGERDESFRVLEWARDITPHNPLPLLNLYYLKQAEDYGLGKGPKLYIDLRDEYPVKVSVICCARSAPDQTAQALKSCLDQTFQDFEILLMNDTGDSAYWEEVKKLDSPKIRHIRIPFFTDAKTRNIALSIASGQYIAYLEAGHTYLPDHLESLVKAMQESDEESIVFFTDPNQNNPSPQKTKKLDEIPEPDFSVERYARECYVPLSCFLVDREAYVMAGGHNEDLTYGAEWEMMLRFTNHFEFNRVKKHTVEVKADAGKPDFTNSAEAYHDNLILAYYGGGLLYSRTMETKDGSYDRFLKSLGWILDKNPSIREIIPFRLLNSSKKYYQAFYELATELKKSGDLENARDLYQAALRIAPMEPKLWMKRIVT